MNAERMLFITVAALLAGGIFLSGWENVHWLLYVLTALVTMAGVTGFCPTLLIYKKLGFK